MYILKALKTVWNLQISMLTAIDDILLYKLFFFLTTRLGSKFCQLQYSRSQENEIIFYLFFFLPIFFPSSTYQKCTIPSHYLNKGWLTAILALVIKIHYFSVMKIILMCLTTAWMFCSKNIPPWSSPKRIFLYS